MKPQDFKGILETIGKDTAMPGYYLYGEEAYLKQRIIARVKEVFVPPDFAEFNLDELWGKELGDGKPLFDALLSLPMMSDRRVVVLRGAERCSKKVIDGLAGFNIPEESILVVEASPPRKTAAFHKTFSKILQPVECDIANDREMISWVVELAKEKNLRMGRSEAPYLVKRAGVNLNALVAELDKLELVAENGAVTIPLIDKMTFHSRSANIFNFSDSFASRDFPKALGAAQRLFEFGESGTMLIAFLKNELITLLRLKTDPEGIKKVRMPPWKKKSYIEWVRNWNAARIKGTIIAAAEADLAIKTGRITEKQALTYIIARAKTLD